MSASQIYDLIVILIFIALGAIILFGAFKKLPAKLQAGFNSAAPLKPVYIKVVGVFIILHVVFLVSEFQSSFVQ